MKSPDLLKHSTLSWRGEDWQPSTAATHLEHYETHEYYADAPDEYHAAEHIGQTAPQVRMPTPPPAMGGGYYNHYPMSPGPYQQPSPY